MDYLLLDIRELETLIAGMRDAEVYPVSFFSQTFNLTHKILKDLHSLETAQIEMLRKQMEEHQALLKSIPHQAAVPMPETPRQEIRTEQGAPVPEIQHIPEPEVIRAEQPKVSMPEPVATPVVEEIPEVKPLVVEVPLVKPEPIVTPVIETKLEPEPVPQPIIKPEPVVEVPQKTATVERPASERQGLFLSDLLEKKNLSDFRKAFSLNDRFRFRRELFGGDEGRMNKAITDLNDIHTYEDSVSYLNNELKWNIEDEAVADFIKLLEKRFL